MTFEEWLWEKTLEDGPPQDDNTLPKTEYGAKFPGTSCALADIDYSEDTDAMLALLFEAG